MRGEKENPYPINWIVQRDWPWAYPEYELILNRPKREVENIFVDPTYYMADINRENNTFFNKP